MAVRLRWRNRARATQVRVYRSDDPFDAAVLPSVLATLGPDENTYLDETAVGGQAYWYAVASVLTGAPDVIAATRAIVSPLGEVSEPAPPPPRFSRVYRDSLSATLTLPAIIPWTNGPVGLWDVADPTRITIPANISLVQISVGVWPIPVALSGNSAAMRIRLRKNGGYAYDGFVQRVYRRRSSAIEDNFLELASPLLAVVAGDYFEVEYHYARGGSGLSNQIRSGSYVLVERFG